MTLLPVLPISSYIHNPPRKGLAFTTYPAVYAVRDWQYGVMNCRGCKDRKMHRNQLMRTA